MDNSDIVYNGNVVNSTTGELEKESELFSPIITSVEHATSQIMSAKGFKEYVGGLAYDTFSGMILDSQNSVKSFITMIKQSQAEILAYSQDKGDIQAFLDTLNAVDYNNLDLSGISNYITTDRKMGNFFKSLLCDLGAVDFGFREGLFGIVESGADLLITNGASVASVFTSIYDRLNGTDYTDKMWDSTKAFVATTHVKNMFDDFYSSTSTGQYIKNNAHNFEGIRGVSNGLGYAAGIVGITLATAGEATPALLGMIGGTAGVGKGLETAWSKGATTKEGLVYGAASGIFEGAQWYVGGSIDAIGGQAVGNGLIRGGAGAALKRVGLSSLDAAAEGAIDPALSMIYNDYGETSLIGNYKAAYEAAGGASNIFKNALIGALGAGFGEFSEIGTNAMSNKVSKAVTSASVLDGTAQMQGLTRNTRQNVSNSVEEIVSEKAVNAFKRKYSDLVSQYGDDFVKTIPVDKLKQLNGLEHVAASSEVSRILNRNITGTLDESLRKTAGNVDDIIRWLRRDVGYTGTDINSVADMIAENVFASTNLSKIRANRMALDNDFVGSFKLISSSLNGGTSTIGVQEASANLFRNMQTYDIDGNMRKAYKKLFDASVAGGTSRELAARNVCKAVEMSDLLRGYKILDVTLNNGEKVQLLVQKHIRNSSGHSMSVADYIDAIKNKPDQLLAAGPSRYVYSDSFSPYDIVTTVNPDFASCIQADGLCKSEMEYFPGRNGQSDKIVLWSGSGSSKTITHELGHSFDCNTGNCAISNSPRWKDAVRADDMEKGIKTMITPYAGVRPAGREYSEDFAECISFFFEDEAYRELLRRKCPHRTRVLEEIFGFV